jgi:hypothetical protein
MGTTTKTLFETDFAEWATRTTQLLRQGQFDALKAENEFENIAAEIEGLARSERTAVRLQLGRLLMRLVKQRIRPEGAGSSWRASIISARTEIDLHFEDSPSLRLHLLNTLERTWQRAVKDALAETALGPRAKELALPKACPWTLDELLEGDLDQITAPASE